MSLRVLQMTAGAPFAAPKSQHFVGGSDFARHTYGKVSLQLATQWGTRAALENAGSPPMPLAICCHMPTAHSVGPATQTCPEGARPRPRVDVSPREQNTALQGLGAFTSGVAGHRPPADSDDVKAWEQTPRPHAACGVFAFGEDE